MRRNSGWFIFVNLFLTQKVVLQIGRQMTFLEGICLFFLSFFLPKTQMRTKDKIMLIFFCQLVFCVVKNASADKRQNWVRFFLSALSCFSNFRKFRQKTFFFCFFVFCLNLRNALRDEKIKKTSSRNSVALEKAIKTFITFYTKMTNIYGKYNNMKLWQWWFLSK